MRGMKMNQKKHVLGRGLSAILDSNDIISNNEAGLDEIYSGKYQPRQHFDATQLQELADSIKQIGILQPILVKRDSSGRFEIVAGERRWRAAKLAGLKTIPIIIKDIADDQYYEAALIENVQRTDLNPIEEAKGIKELLDKFKYTHETVAQKLGKSRSYVANTIRLLGLPEKIQNYVFDGKLTPGHARALMQAEDPMALADKIINENLSVREAENLSRKYKGGFNPEYIQSNDLNTIRETLQSVLKTQVTIRCDGSSGYISIRFNSLEQLDDLLSVLAR